MLLCKEIQFARPTDEPTLRTLSMVYRSASKCKQSSMNDVRLTLHVVVQLRVRPDIVAKTRHTFPHRRRNDQAVRTCFQDEPQERKLGNSVVHVSGACSGLQGPADGTFCTTAEGYHTAGKPTWISCTDNASILFETTQVALQLHKNFKKSNHMFWAIMSITLQVCGILHKRKNSYHSLASLS